MRKIKARMRQLVDHLRADVARITEPGAQALFEPSAEVLIGLIKAFDDCEKQSARAWRAIPTASRPEKGISHAARR